MTRFFLPALSLLFVAGVASAAGEGYTVSEVMATKTTLAGQPIVPPSPAMVHFSTYTMAPGAQLPVHRHPYPRYGYVISGSLDVTLVDRHQTFHFQPGDAFAEAIGEWHVGSNPGSTPTVLLLIDQTPPEVLSNTVDREDQPVH